MRLSNFDMYPGPLQRRDIGIGVFDTSDCMRSYRFRKTFQGNSHFFHIADRIFHQMVGLDIE